MFFEWGYFFLLLLVGVSGTQVLFSLWAELRSEPHWFSFNPVLSLLQAILGVSSFCILAAAFLYDDFSFLYVAAHSNSQLPDFFKFAATWGGHEGSMLFWLAALCLWSGIFCVFSGKIDRLFAHRTLAVLAMIILSFALFIVCFSSPFERGFPPPPEGRDLNPMLQDIGLIMHPPLLYLGYVGFAVVFAMSIAVLISGVLDFAGARWIRPWALTAWGFLTAGIMLGAWWAYYELGWGGWWFWDPVENASLMPWLLGTALLHSLIVSEQRGIFNYWTMLLAIFTFALSLLGTFIVRSGVLTSVHAFAVDAERGIAILSLFGIFSVVGLALFALRANFWQGNVRFHLLSKESAFLLINGLFSVAAFVVVLGTFYPMIFSAMGWGSISVGAPYFNRLFIPIVLLLCAVMVFAVVLRWKSPEQNVLRRKWFMLPVAIILSLVLIWHVIAKTNVHSIELLPLLFVILAFWLILTHLPILPFMWHLRPLAMRLAHIGFALGIIGAMMNSYYGDEIGLRMKPADRAELAGFYFEYQELDYTLGQNYTGETAKFTVSDANNRILSRVQPERRYYDIRTMTMAEVGLFHHGLDDIYIVMGDKLGEKEYAFRLHYKPYIRLLWLGGILMVIAAVMAAIGVRKTQKNFMRNK